MNFEDFKIHGKDVIEYICNYLATVKDRRVIPDVEPGFLRELLPENAPDYPDEWSDIMNDLETKIMSGMTHWQHPGFHAYFPSGNSYPGILADMLSDAIGCMGFSWVAGPSCAELESIVLDWFGKAIGLPKEFLACTENSKGGGVLQSSASDCIFVAMLAARTQALKRLQEQRPFVEKGVLLSKLVAYSSVQAHSCVQKAAMLCLVKLHILEPDEHNVLRGDVLKKAMDEDVKLGLVPFYVSTTLGTTACCSFDNLSEIGPVCREQPCVWLHVDGAYGGSFFICPELRQFLNGVEYADSFNTNPNKGLFLNFDCSAMWVRDSKKFTEGFIVDPLYLQYKNSNYAIDYRHWGVSLSRRFRSLKLWFMFRMCGIVQLQEFMRNNIKMAKLFEQYVNSDSRFEVCNDVKLGLVCFRLHGSDDLNMELLSNINASGKLHMVPAEVQKKKIIRFCLNATQVKREDIDDAWHIIRKFADELLEDKQADKRKTSMLVHMCSNPKLCADFMTVTVPPEKKDLATTTAGSEKKSLFSRPLVNFFQLRKKYDVQELNSESKPPLPLESTTKSPSPKADNGSGPQ